jgi:hypothetical protein
MSDPFSLSDSLWSKDLRRSDDCRETGVGRDDMVAISLIQKLRGKSGRPQLASTNAIIVIGTFGC